MLVLVILALRTLSQEDCLVFETLLDDIVNYKSSRLAW